MSSLRERVLTFLRDDYRIHRDDPLNSQLGAFKRDEHEEAFRVRLKQLLADDQLLEAQRWLVFHGHLAAGAPLSRRALRKEATRALAATPNGTAVRRRGNLCERIMECALDQGMGRSALGDGDERALRRQLAEADYQKQRGPAWPPFTLQGEDYQRLLACLIGAEAEAWLYDAGYPLAEQLRQERLAQGNDDWEEAVKESGSAVGSRKVQAAAAGADAALDSDPLVVSAPRKPRLEAIPLGLVERYQQAAYGSDPGAVGTPGPAEAPGIPAASQATGAAGTTHPATATGPADDLQAQIIQLWDSLASDPESYSDVLLPLLLDDHSGAGLYLMGPDLLEGERHAVEAWCSRATRDKMRAVGPQPFFFAILRRSDEPQLDLLPFPLLRERATVGDTRLENMSVEVLAPERTVPLTVANALGIFRDECAANPRFNPNLAFYRQTNLFLPKKCPARFRPLFAEDDF